MINRDVRNQTKNKVNQCGNVYQNNQAELKLYMKLYLLNVFENYKYKIVYYDPDTESIYSVIGIVTGFSGSNTSPSIDIVYDPKDIEKMSSNKTNNCIKNGTRCSFYDYCHKRYSDEDISNCGCMIKVKADENTPQKTSIIASNIISIELASKEKCCCSQTDDKKEKEEVKILLLGISATQIRSVIINMKFIDDQMDNAFKEVNFEVGKRYNVVFNDKQSPTTGCDCGNNYEISGTLLSLSPVKDCACKDPNTSNSIVRATTCDHPEEIVGLHNSIYPAVDCSTDKDKFLVSEPIKEDYNLVFDTTSMPMNATTCTIRLSQIRDVNELPGSSCTNQDKDHCCCCSIDEDRFEIKGKEYVYNNGKVYKVTEGECDFNHSYPLIEILQYYFFDK